MTKTIQRRDHIQQVVHERGSVSVGALADMLGVSMQTIRRDLDILCENKALRRIHGRIEMADAQMNVSFDQRADTNLVGKRAIAAFAATQVPDGATMFVSIGSTVLSVAQALRPKKELTVITNNLSVAMALSNEPSNRIILPGGELRLPDRDFIGEDVVEFFSRYRAEYAIFGTAGISPTGDLLEFHEAEVRATNMMRQNALKSILVIDHSKFGRLAPAAGGNLKDIDLVVCDRPPASDYANLLAEIEQPIIFAEEADLT